MQYILFVIGSIFGSFICAYAYRFINQESIVKGRSHCEHCGKILNWYELIPIFSYILLKGKCSSCHHKIRFMHVTIELLGGCICVFAYAKYHFSISMAIILYICFVLLFIGLVDYYTMDVYLFHLMWLLIGILMYLYIYPIPLLKTIHYLFYLSVPLFIVNVLFKPCFGEGDLYLISLLGLLIKEKTIYMMMNAMMIASCHIFIYRRNKKEMIPFVPYIVASLYLILLF